MSIACCSVSATVRWPSKSSALWSASEIVVATFDANSIWAGVNATGAVWWFMNMTPMTRLCTISGMVRTDRIAYPSITARLTRGSSYASSIATGAAV